jgi:hypothetical protein
VLRTVRDPSISDDYYSLPIGTADASSTDPIIPDEVYKAAGLAYHQIWMLSVDDQVSRKHTLLSMDISGRSFLYGDSDSKKISRFPSGLLPNECGFWMAQSK